MRLYVFANTEVEASLAGLTPSQALRGGLAFTEIHYLKFLGAEGLRFENGDWIQVHQRLGEQMAEWCMDALVKDCAQQSSFLRVLDLHTFEVMKWPTYTS